MIWTNIFFIVLHVISVFAGVAAAVLWLRSASIDIPDMAPSRHHKNAKGTLSDEWMDQFAGNLRQHRQKWLKSTKLNKAAATSAAVAALAQATLYLINLLNLLAKI